VCYEKAEVFFECGHGMCLQCCKRWVGFRNTCPTCRADDCTRRMAQMGAYEDECEKLARLRASGYTCHIPPVTFFEHTKIVTGLVYIT